jgi:hypothetical protein
MKTHLKTSASSIGEYVMKNMLSNMSTHTSKSVVLAAKQAYNLRVTLENSYLGCHHKVVHKEVLVFWE